MEARRAPGRPVRRIDPAVVPALLAWFRRTERPLPWRTRRDPYRTWLAEVLLQQTRVAQARPFFERLTGRFPDVERLARASVDDVLKAWEGAGYYARARNLHAAARRIVAEHRGRLPRSRAELERLPGVGPYIAAALASLCFGEPVLALEANGLRVGARLIAETASIGKRPARRRVSTALEQLVPGRDPGRFNEALMELGETVCLPRQPRCPACPVARFCHAVKEFPDPGVIPRRGPHRSKPTVEAAVIAVQRGNRWLVQRRRSDGLLGGLWEFPGGKLRPAERPERAARRELEEETGIRSSRLIPVGLLRHEYSHFRVRLHLYYLRVDRARVRPGPNRARWASDAEFERLPRPRATIRAMDRFRELVAERGKDLTRVQDPVGVARRLDPAQKRDRLRRHLKR